MTRIIFNIETETRNNSNPQSNAVSSPSLMMDNETILLGQIERLKRERDQILKDNDLWRSCPQNSNSVNYEKGES